MWTGLGRIPVECKTLHSKLLKTQALTVQVLLQDLKRAGYTGRHLLARIQRTGYLSDWTREHWDQAAVELTDVRRAGPSLPSDIGQVMDATVT
jgi:hypothetical protein